MNKISKRLKAVADFVDQEDKIVDVGCDHGLLSIYLYQNKLCNSVIATDINVKALSGAVKNINSLNLHIKTFVSDGIKDIPLDLFNTLIISGMGTNTILHILKDENKLMGVKKIILQSNNEHSLLRKALNKKGYYLSDESVIFEKEKYYITMSFVFDKKKNSKKEIKYGLIKDDKGEYYQYLIKSNKNILKRIPKKNFLLRLKFKKTIFDLKQQYKKTI